MCVSRFCRRDDLLVEIEGIVACNPTTPAEPNEPAEVTEQPAKTDDQQPVDTQPEPEKVVSAEDGVLVFTRTLPENKVTVKVELKAPWGWEIIAE